MDNNAIMDDNARLHLQKMIKANNVEDQTDLIRQLKHSEILKKDVEVLVNLRDKYNEEQQDLLNLEAMNQCNFLFTYYTDIYNKIRKYEIDLGILSKFLDVLRRIEDGELDQHEGSFLVGTLLKELYVDSALKKADKLEKDRQQNEEPKEVMKGPSVEISWKQFKYMNRK